MLYSNLTFSDLQKFGSDIVDNLNNVGEYKHFNIQLRDVLAESIADNCWNLTVVVSYNDASEFNHTVKIQSEDADTLEDLKENYSREFLREFSEFFSDLAETEERLEDDAQDTDEPWYRQGEGGYFDQKFGYVENKVTESHNPDPWKIVARFENHDDEVVIGGESEDDCIVQMDELQDKWGQVTWYSGVNGGGYYDGEYVGDDDDDLDESKAGKLHTSFVEASYGGAYDIADDQYFTKEDLTDFSEAVLEMIKEWLLSVGHRLIGTDSLNVNKIELDGNTVTMGIEYYNEQTGIQIEPEYSFTVDMRKITKPTDLIGKYSDLAFSYFYKEIADDVFSYINTGSLPFSKEDLEQALKNAIVQYFTGPAGGFEESEVWDYAGFEIETKEDHVEVKVHAELSYDGLWSLKEELDPIIQQYDKDAYFDFEDTGRMDAYLWNVVKESVTEADDTGYFGVFRVGGSVGEASGKIVKVFTSEEDAKECAKSRNKLLSPGEKKYYGIKYRAKALTSADLKDDGVQAMINEIGIVTESIEGDEEEKFWDLYDNCTDEQADEIDEIIEQLGWDDIFFPEDMTYGPKATEAQYAKVLEIYDAHQGKETPDKE